MAALRAYRPDIDGMRAIAVLSVVAFHYGLHAPGGFIGVDVFFVISGFLIGSLIYREACEGTFSYRGFYVRRARRIVPALLAVLAVTYASMLLLATPEELRKFGASAVATAFSASNIYLWHSINYFRPTAALNPLLMTWSLGVEEQFYLLAPVFLLLLIRLRERWRPLAIAGLIVVSLGLAMWGVRHAREAAFFLLPTRAWELAAGVLLGVLDIHRARSGAAPRNTGPGVELRALAGLALIGVPAFFYDSVTPFPGAAALPPVLGTVLLLGASGSFTNRRLLSAPVMRFFGLISYSLYLWHWPLISVTRLVLVHKPSLAVRVGLLLLSIVLAWLCYRFIEQPFRRSRSPAGITLWRYAGALGLVAAVAGLAFVLHGFPGRWPTSFQAMAKEAAGNADPCLVDSGSSAPRASEACYPRDGKGALVAVVGDSHAAALAPGLRALVEREGLGLVEMTKASCPFLVGVSQRVWKSPSHVRECAQFDKRVMHLLLDDRRIVTVVIAGAWLRQPLRKASYVAIDGSRGSSDAMLARGLAAAVSALHKAGKWVVIVRDVPFFDFLPQKRLAACANRLRAELNGGTAIDCDFIARADVRSDRVAYGILVNVARETGALLADPSPALCEAHRGCRISANGHALYLDSQHLSAAGAARVSTTFAGVLRPPTAVVAGQGVDVSTGTANAR